MVEKIQPRLGFWFQWLVVNAVGWMMGMILRQFLFGISGLATNLTLIGAVIGAVVGIAQLLVLAQPRVRAGMWVLASIGGWAVGWGVGWGLGWDIIGSQGFTAVFGMIGMISGLITGVIQWFSLRHQTDQAGWWIPANTVGWGMGLAAGVIIGGAFGWFAAGAVSGAITGLALVLILNP